MDDWTRAIAVRLKREIEERELQDARFFETHKVKKESAPDLWKELKERVGRHCFDLNQEMGQDILTVETTPETEISIRAMLGGQIRILRARFDEDAENIKYDGGTHSGTFEVERTETGEGILTSRNIPYSVEDAAKEMLATLLVLPRLKVN